MAENKYSVRIRQAYAALNVLKPAIQKLAKDGKTNTPQYAALTKQLQDAQANYDKLIRAEERFLAQEEANKKAKGAKPLQGDLTIALASGDKAKAKDIAQDMIDAGVQPIGLDGKPLPGYTLEQPQAETPKGETPKDGKVEGFTPTVKYGSPTGAQYGPNLPEKTPAADKPKSTTTKDGTVIPAGADDKTVWVSYLKATFKGLEDPAMKKQIDALITRANKFNMSESEFMTELQGTTWWQSTYPSLRQFFIESNDPRNKANFAEKVQNNIESVTRKLESLGVRINDIDPTTGKIIDNTELIRGIALQTIQNSWDDNDLNDYLAGRSDVLFTGGGTIGSSFESIKRQASLYGVSIDKNFEKEINLSLLDSNDARDANYWLTEMKQQAYDNPMYKAFAPAMKDNNRTLYEVTNSYRKQMADLLEVDASVITWKDLMDKAVDSTTGNARTFADFTKSVKKDPMWQYTKNAKETYSNMALDIAKMFGFAG